MVVQSYTVLVVDKAELVRQTTNRILTKEGYRVLEAADAKEALAVLAMPRARVDLVLIGAVGQLARLLPPLPPPRRRTRRSPGHFV